ncbi:hypothetical protein COU80_00605 [Candidatus Peregrinibacteria bacterium CG10_big_fil_rev_8_21_14_0_10_55_24]|nr:MAG: hypothetical protein COU80_00605 [Candidatus Peregrinibacteria bacterium CG10_big_fil_rev_8_21_14_0_10_55_24]
MAKSVDITGKFGVPPIQQELPSSARRQLLLQHATDPSAARVALMIVLEARGGRPPEDGMETKGSGVPVPTKPPELPANAAKLLPTGQE